MYHLGYGLLYLSRVVMMKKVIGFVIIVALLAVGMPYFLGVRTEQVYKDWVDLIAKESSQAQIPYKLVEYKRGIFSSIAVTEVIINKITVRVTDKIQHGPILYDASKVKPNGVELGAALVQSSFAFVPEIPVYTTIRTIFGNQDPISFKSIIGFTGGLKTFIHSPAIEHINHANNRTIIWQGMEAQASNDQALKVFKGIMKVPGLTIKTDQYNGAFKDFHAESDSKRGAYNLWTGDATSSVEKIEIIPAKTGTYVLENLKLHLSSKIDNALYQGQIDFVMSNIQIQSPTDSYGPIAIGLKFLNLDPEGISMVQNAINNSAVFPGPASLKPAMMKLLLKTPTLVIENTHVTFPEGDVKIDATISVGGPTIADNFDSSIYTKTLEGDVKVIMGKEILKKYLKSDMERGIKAKPEVAALPKEEQNVQVDKAIMLKIEKLKVSGLLTEQAQTFELKFNIQHGKPMVNGKEVDIAELYRGNAS